MQRIPRNAHISAGQKELLLKFMATNPKLRCGKFDADFKYADSSRQWKNISQALNGVPGATKEWHYWRKTWHDLRKNYKSKVLQKVVAEGGERTDLSPSEIEQRINEIIFQKSAVLDSDPKENFLKSDISMGLDGQDYYYQASNRKDQDSETIISEVELAEREQDGFYMENDNSRIAETERNINDSFAMGGNMINSKSLLIKEEPHYHEGNIDIQDELYADQSSQMYSDQQHHISNTDGYPSRRHGMKRKLENAVERKDNQIDLFFKSMAECVKTFPPELANQAKMKVCSIVCQLELQALTKNIPLSNTTKRQSSGYPSSDS